jgi:hypothetical protein
MRNKKKTIYFIGGGILLAFVGLQYFFGILTTKAEVTLLERLTTLGDAVQSGNNSSQQPSFSDDGNMVAFISSATNLVAGDTNGADDAFVVNRTTEEITRVSIASDGTQSDDTVWRVRISGDGRYVVFESPATNLVSGDINGQADIFIHDLQTTTTELINFKSDGSPGVGGAGWPEISYDGRYTIFNSDEALVPTDTNNQYDIYIRDRQLDTTELVSIGDDESVGDNYTVYAGISSDARYVVFSSNATNLVAGDTNGVVDVFVRDRQLGTTEIVSISDAEVLGNGGASSGLDISDDGRYVVFSSNATNLVAGDTNGVVDVFVRDRQLGTTERLSVTQAGVEDNADSFWPKLSGDGRYVTFETTSDFVPEDTNAVKDIYYRDIQSDTIQRASVATDGSQVSVATENYGSNLLSSNGRYVAFQTVSTFVASDINNQPDIYIRDLDLGITERLFEFQNSIEQINAHPNYPAISEDNNLVVFESEASNLVDGDTNGQVDVFVLNRSSGVFERVSVDSSGAQTDSSSYDPDISADGRYVVFESGATNLVAGDTNGFNDIFVRDLQTDTTERVSVSTASLQTNGDSEDAQISSNGRYVVFSSTATNLVGGDTNLERDIFVRDLQLGITERVNLSSSEVEADSSSSNPDISGDGRYVVFESPSTNLVSGDTEGARDIFLRDRNLGTTIAVTHRLATTHGNNASSYTGLSSDGTMAIFSSSASDLVVGDTNGAEDIFVINRTSGLITRVSVSSGGTEADGVSSYPSISSDGRYAIFTSSATNLVAGDTNGFEDVFLHDIQTGITERISISDSELETNEGSFTQLGASIISDDGRYVVFSSSATNLVAGDSNNVVDVFMRDRQAGSTTRVSLSDGELEGDGFSSMAAISSDGTKAAFMSAASNLVIGDTNSLVDVFVRDLINGTTERASVSSLEAESVGGIGGSTVLISGDGRYVFFHSDGSDLVSGDSNATNDIFVRDTLNGTTERVSVADDEQEGDQGSDSDMFAISADGRKVVFLSGSTNLVAGDTNNQSDVFLRDLDSQTTERLSLSSDGAQANAGPASGLGISADGSLVVFSSTATNLASEGIFSGAYATVFVRNRNSDTTTFLISLSETSIEADNSSYFPVISSDGTTVAFSSSATNLVSGDVLNKEDIFTFSTGDNTLERISYGISGEANDQSQLPVVSADGSKVAFYSYATNLVTSDTNATSDVFLFDRDSDEMVLISKSMAGVQSNAQDDADNGYILSISPDGGYVAFVSDATNLVSEEDNNLSADLFFAKIGGTIVSPPVVQTQNGSVPIPGQIKQVPKDTPVSPVTSCTSQYFDKYLRRGMLGLQVVKVQRFLFDRGFYRGPINGIFGPKTENGIKKFQARYSKEVLSPWNLTNPTGVWGRTTRAMANKFEGCNEGLVTLPNGNIVTF